MSGADKTKLNGIVEDQHPLKQGLKPLASASAWAFVICRRPTSTKTRIETIYYGKSGATTDRSKTNIH